MHVENIYVGSAHTHTHTHTHPPPPSFYTPIPFRELRTLRPLHLLLLAHVEGLLAPAEGLLALGRTGAVLSPFLPLAFRFLPPLPHPIALSTYLSFHSPSSAHTRCAQTNVCNICICVCVRELLLRYVALVIFIFTPLQP